jgi:hypothetical protein
MAAAVGTDRQVEIERALDAVVDIAADRWRRAADRDTRAYPSSGR